MQKPKIFVSWNIYFYLLCCRDKITDASQVVCFSDFSNENMMNPINMVHIVVANDHALKNNLINCCICHHKLLKLVHSPIHGQKEQVLEVKSARKFGPAPSTICLGHKLRSVRSNEFAKNLQTIYSPIPQWLMILKGITQTICSGTKCYCFNTLLVK